MPDQTTKIAVFIADEQKELVEQLTELINSTSDMYVASTAFNGGDLYTYFKNGKNGIQVALVDIGMPVMDGLTATAKIKEICGDDLKVLIMTGLNGRDYATEAVNKFADGFVAKYHSQDEIVNAIRQVLAHKDFFYKPDPTDITHPVITPKRLPGLIPIERRILCLLVKGAISKDIAVELDQTIYNVDRVRRIIMHKLGADTPVMLGVIAEKHGLCR
jgi:DNA-binding NarL/FixJ family response regulator